MNIEGDVDRKQNKDAKIIPKKVELYCSIFLLATFVKVDGVLGNKTEFPSINIFSYDFVILEKMQRCPAFGRRLTSYSDSQLSLNLIYPVSTPKLIRREYYMCLFHGPDSQLRESTENASRNQLLLILFPLFCRSTLSRRMNTVVQKA